MERRISRSDRISSCDSSSSSSSSSDSGSSSSSSNSTDMQCSGAGASQQYKHRQGEANAIIKRPGGGKAKDAPQRLDKVLYADWEETPLLNSREKQNM